MEDVYFNIDRLKKYGYGVPRLLILAWAAFAIAPTLQHVADQDFGLQAYFHSWRWIVHAYVGSIGAIVNVQRFGLLGNVVILLGAASLIFWDAMTFDVTLLIVLMKTMGGDFLAGKLDTAEWKLVLLFTFGVLLPLACLLPSMSTHGGALATGADVLLQEYLHVFPFLFAIQLICEYGDANYEKMAFFRYRYSFETLTAGLLFLGPALAKVQTDFLGSHNGGHLVGGIAGLFFWRALALRVVQHDLMVCFFYRVSNLLQILARCPILTMWQRASFRLYGLYHGMRMVYVSDFEVAMAVLKASDCKGDCLERHVATPAWAPIISLESVDGPLYHRMIKDFHTMYKGLPPASKLAECARKHTEVLKKSGKVVDAHAMVQLSLEVFIDYLFDREWEPAFQVLADASWEWRKEIAAKGKGDMAVKEGAVKCVVEDLLWRHSPTWVLFGERWRKPEYFSLIMQPFIISPAINISDIAVAFKLQPGMGVDEAVRSMHPFPILERFVDVDVVTRSGEVCVKANSQVIMFSSDFKASPFPVFGAGPRACAGTNLARPFIKVIHSELATHELFHPQVNHLHSGRHNDSTTSLGETLYLIKTLFPVLFRRSKARTNFGKSLEAHYDD